MIHALHQRDRIGRGGQEVTLESIEILDAELDLRLGRVLGHLTQHVGGALLFVIRRRHAGEDGQRRVKRADHVLGAQSVVAVDGPLEMHDRGLAELGVRADRIRVRRADRDRRALQPEIIEFLAHLL